MIVKMYADLVELKLRATTEADATAWGVVIVLVKYRADVVVELAKRQTAA
ncbi:hypothetical protein [Acetobacterium tundrae]|uniref:Uncharacterized protein n=1 Tax=Acetobacterium tundrae TaxID=132932 RepID=A0ABR6WIV6_9FIRM|nr:hypothetical protein [Acetobacterium tundrae]MBC3796424.1 hypothetical protein [Acetobacterium tundrae]